MVKGPDDSYTSPAMPQPSESEDWVRRYLDLWQDQISSMASDPAFAKSLLAPMTNVLSTLPTGDPCAPRDAFDPRWLQQDARSWLESLAPPGQAAAQMPHPLHICSTTCIPVPSSV